MEALAAPASPRKLSWLASNSFMWVMGMAWLVLTVIDVISAAELITASINQAWLIMLGGLFANRSRERHTDDAE